MKNHKFQCDKCGLCCMNLHRSPIYLELNRGDGICKHFDETTHLCTIYDTRPIMCRVDEAYDKHFKDKIKIEDYYKSNYESCKKLKSERK